jgi:flagellar secretion chaperone FliS
LGEMLASVRATKSELNTQLADLYWFLFRRTTDAKINGDAAALAEVLRLLEFERQTWQLACDKFNGGSGVAPPAPRSAYVSTRGPTSNSGFSFQA